MGQTKKQLKDGSFIKKNFITGENDQQGMKIINDTRTSKHLPLK